MTDKPFCESIQRTKKFFDNATKIFDEKDEAFAPKPGMFTVAHQIAHAAQAIDWFVEGAFSATGMGVDFEKMEMEIRKIQTLKEARAWMDRAVAHALEVLKNKSMPELMQPIAGHVMAGAPRLAICEAIADHTAHHRGALAVYARLLGKVPPMPYE